MSRDAFLDSSILWAFVGPPQFEPQHGACVAVFDHPQVRRYTSESVLGEVRQTERRKARLYSNMIFHFQLRRRPEEFSVDAFSRHVADRARQLLRGFRGNEADIEFLRRLGQEDSARLRAAWSKIERPLVPTRNDAYFEDSLRATIGLERQDSKVVTDFVFWAAERDRAAFVTTDGGLLRVVRTRLQSFLGSLYMLKPTADDFLEPDAFLSSLAR